MGSEERERHESAIRRTEALVARLEAGELGDEEHRRLLWEDFEQRHLEGGRFVEDRGGALEVGGRYLFALGDIVDGTQDAYRFEERARTRWRVFWGDELEDVDRALSEIGNCLATLSTLAGPPNEDFEAAARSICEDAARYRSARHGLVVRQQPIGLAHKSSPLSTH